MGEQGAGVPAGKGGAQRRDVQGNGQGDPGRLDWFTRAVPPGGGRRVQIRRCTRSTPTEAVDLDPGASALLLAVLGEVARAEPAVTCHATRQAVLRGFWRTLKERGPAPDGRCPACNTLAYVALKDACTRDGAKAAGTDAQWPAQAAHRQSVAVAASAHAREDQAFIDAATDWNNE